MLDIYYGLDIDLSNFTKLFLFFWRRLIVISKMYRMKESFVSLENNPRRTVRSLRKDFFRSTSTSSLILTAVTEFST